MYVRSYRVMLECITVVCRIINGVVVYREYLLIVIDLGVMSGYDVSVCLCNDVIIILYCVC